MDGRKRGHHHGDARAALLRAAAASLEEAGAGGLSLRGVAEGAGLSRQAPYNHFANKEAMLAALAEDGFRRLAAAVRVASAGKAGPAALEAAGEAYVALAQTAPALFRLMFTRELVDASRFSAVEAASADAFAALVAVVAGMCRPERVEEASLGAWCIVHGYATLCNETGLEPPERRGERMLQFTRMIATSEALTMPLDRPR